MDRSATHLSAAAFRRKLRSSCGHSSNSHSGENTNGTLFSSPKPTPSFSISLSRRKGEKGALPTTSTKLTSLQSVVPSNKISQPASTGDDNPLVALVVRILSLEWGVRWGTSESKYPMLGECGEDIVAMMQYLAKK